MDFWNTVAEASNGPLNIGEACKRLSLALAKLPESEVLEFCVEFDRKMEEAYTWELWGIAYLIGGGCGDDSFMDFRGSLIASGREVFENAMLDADSLLVLDQSHLSEMFEEGYIYCGPTVYERMAGTQPETNVVRKESPSGQQWEETAESLQQFYPKAWIIYGWEESPAAEPVVDKKPWWKLW